MAISHRHHLNASVGVDTLFSDLVYGLFLSRYQSCLPLSIQGNDIIRPHYLDRR
jgi:hypothetical protein